MQDVLRYSIVNLQDAAVTLGGFPFDNSTRVVHRIDERSAAEPVGAPRRGRPGRRHGDEHVVPDQWRASTTVDHAAHAARPAGALLSRAALRAEDAGVRRAAHASSARSRSIDSSTATSRRRKCSPASLIMLFYDNVIESVSGVASFLPPEQLAAFEARARAVGLPYRLGGAALAVRLRQRP